MLRSDARADLAQAGDSDKPGLGRNARAPGRRASALNLPGGAEADLWRTCFSRRRYFAPRVGASRYARISGTATGVAARVLSWRRRSQPGLCNATNADAR